MVRSYTIQVVIGVLVIVGIAAMSAQATAAGDIQPQVEPAEADNIDDEEFEELEEASGETVGELVGTLTNRLQGAMQDGGPPAAIEVCTEDAIDIKHEMSRERGAEITRVSDGVRDPLLGIPDEWEQETFEGFKEDADAGTSPEELEQSVVVSQGEDEYYRYMTALPTQQVCTNCHGPADEIDPAVAETLDDNYPHDQAMGYEEGDLRGAVSIKVPLPEDEEIPMLAMEEIGDEGVGEEPNDQDNEAGTNDDGDGVEEPADDTTNEMPGFGILPAILGALVAGSIMIVRRQ